MNRYNFSKQATFCGEDVIIRVENTPDGAIRISLKTPAGEPYATASIHPDNFPGVEFAPDQVVIKDYSENNGILALLVRENIVREPTFGIRSGHVIVPICTLLITPEVETVNANPE